MDNLHFNEEFFKYRKFKSFIRVGSTFIDIKQALGFSFIENPEGYLIVQFIYDSGRALNAMLQDRNEFAQFLMELEPFIDDDLSLASLNEFMDKIEIECNKAHDKFKFKTKKHSFKDSIRNNNKDETNENK